jgi:hypothetical protein
MKAYKVKSKREKSARALKPFLFDAVNFVRDFTR